jgi:hypothetical protein
MATQATDRDRLVAGSHVERYYCFPLQLDTPLVASLPLQRAAPS